MIKYCGVKISREVWNEMQRDAYDPNDQPKMYYCEICGHKHRYKSKIGFLHNQSIPIQIRISTAKTWGKSLSEYY